MVIHSAGSLLDADISNSNADGDTPPENVWPHASFREEARFVRGRLYHARRIHRCKFVGRARRALRSH